MSASATLIPYGSAGRSWVPWRRKHSGKNRTPKLLMREDDEESAPPHTRVDLDTGTVRLRPPA